MVQNLNVSVIGPNTLQLALVYNNNNDTTATNNNNNSTHNGGDGNNHTYKRGRVSIFGKVELVDETIADAVVDAKANHVFEELKRLEDYEDALDVENDELNKNGHSNTSTTSNDGDRSKGSDVDV